MGRFAGTNKRGEGDLNSRVFCPNGAGFCMGFGPGFLFLAACVVVQVWRCPLARLNTATVLHPFGGG